MAKIPGRKICNIGFPSFTEECKYIDNLVNEANDLLPQQHSYPKEIDRERARETLALISKQNGRVIEEINRTEQTISNGNEWLSKLLNHEKIDFERIKKFVVNIEKKYEKDTCSNAVDENAVNLDENILNETVKSFPSSDDTIMSTPKFFKAVPQVQLVEISPNLFVKQEPSIWDQRYLNAEAKLRRLSRAMKKT